MENEIKVNEYVRDNKGLIFYIIGVDYDDYITDIIYNPEIHKGYKGRYDFGVKDYLLYFTKEQISKLKHSPNLIDIIEDDDFCKIEFYSPRYKKRGTRIFEVTKIDEYITFENMHCDLFMINGEWSNNDKRLNPVIKEIYTKGMMESISYKVERKD